MAPAPFRCSGELTAQQRRMFWEALVSVARQRQVGKSRGGTGGRAPGTGYGGKLVCRGACREFSDYDFEGLGWPSGWARLNHRIDALCQHPDVKRIGLDRPD